MHLWLVLLLLMAAWRKAVKYISYTRKGKLGIHYFYFILLLLLAVVTWPLNMQCVDFCL